MCVLPTLCCHHGLIKVQSESTEKLEHPNTYRASTGHERCLRFTANGERGSSVTLAERTCRQSSSGSVSGQCEFGSVEIIGTRKSLIETNRYELKDSFVTHYFIVSYSFCASSKVIHHKSYYVVPHYIMITSPLLTLLKGDLLC